MEDIGVYNPSQAVAQAEAVIALATGADKARRARDDAIAEEAAARARTAELRAYDEALTTHVNTLQARLDDLRGGVSIEERKLRARVLEMEHYLAALHEQTHQLEVMNQKSIEYQYEQLRKWRGEPLHPTPVDPYGPAMIPAGSPDGIGHAEAFKAPTPAPVEDQAAAGWEVEA